MRSTRSASSTGCSSMRHRPTASFAYTSGGDRKVVKLEPGEAFHLTLLASQLASFTSSPRAARSRSRRAWREPVDPIRSRRTRDIKISRTVTPSGVAKSSDLVKVDLVVDFGPLQPTGCVMVTDYVPSGLVPVGNLRGWVDEEEESDPQQSTETRPFAADRPARLLLCGADARRAARSRCATSPGSSAPVGTPGRRRSRSRPSGRTARP